MELSPKLLQEFAKLANSSSEEKPSTQVYGTIKVDGENKFVQLDGSDCLTPISEVVDAQAGDRVLVTIENHRATILGNFTYPPSARTANDALSASGEAISKSESAEEKAQEALDETDKQTEIINAANAAAQEAKTNAAQAGSLATEASNKASTAQSLAEEAKQSASKAETDAASAMTNVGKANEELAKVQKEVDDVQADALKIRTDVQADLDAFTQTISATYAGKTELTTLEGTLTAKINQSVAGLEATFTDNYVAKSENVALEERLQTQITANASGFASQATKISKLETDTSEAQKAIDAAQKDADDALIAAGQAQTKANAAQTAADEATAKANAADEALTLAKADLATAQANLAAVTGRVDATEDEIAAAQEAVSEAQTKVDIAQKDATAAQTAAGEAKTAASNAATKAQEAKTAADQAQADANALKTRVTAAETKIDQTAESIKLLATKEEVTDALSDYSTTVQMNAAINLKADAITQTVSATYATQSSVKEVKTTAEQTATKFSWIVASGTSASNFTITDRMANITAEKINLKGLVSFSGLNSDAQAVINDAKSKAEDAYNTADAAGQVSYNANLKLASWCHANNQTLIDGSKIYTGSITAVQIEADAITADKIKANSIDTAHIVAGAITSDKISVESLSAICATIGGFTIHDNYLECEQDNTAEIKINFAGPPTAPLLYGYIRIGNMEAGGEGFEISSYDAANYRFVTVEMGNMSAGITVSSNTEVLELHPEGLVHYTISKGVKTVSDLFIASNLAFSDGTTVGTNLNPSGAHYLGTDANIYGNSHFSSGSYKATKMIGLSIETIGNTTNTEEVIHIGDKSNTAIGGISINNTLRFSNEQQVGTSQYPSGNHVLANTKGVYGKDMYGDAYRLIGTTNVAVGTNSMTCVEVGGDGGLPLYFSCGLLFSYFEQVGSNMFPSGDHYLGNAKYIYGVKNGTTTKSRIIGLTSNDNIAIGGSDGTCSVYLGSGKKFNVYEYVNENTDSILLSASTSEFAVYSDNFSVSSIELCVPVVYSNTTSSGSNIRVLDDTGKLCRYSSSSRRYKEAISEKLSEHLNPHKLYDIPVVEFVYKDGHLSNDDERYGQKFIGFIAEDIDEVYPIAANHNKDGTVENWNVDLIVPGMLKLIQEQHKVDISLNSQVETLKNQLDEAMIKIASLEKQIDILKTA